MKNYYYQKALILELLFLTSNSFEKKKCRDMRKTLESQNFRLKLLYSKEFDYLTSETPLTQNTNMRVLLKVLLSINFKDSLNQNSLNRIVRNMLLLSDSKLFTYFKKLEDSECSQSYRLTMIIQQLYQVYNLKQTEQWDVENDVS